MRRPPSNAAATDLARVPQPVRRRRTGWPEGHDGGHLRGDPQCIRTEGLTGQTRQSDLSKHGDCDSPTGPWATGDQSVVKVSQGASDEAKCTPSRPSPDARLTITVGRQSTEGQCSSRYHSNRSKIRSAVCVSVLGCASQADSPLHHLSTPTAGLISASRRFLAGP